ncbi:MAG: helix-turn-helix domain-containing protein [Anaerovoracaceae bacterium]
MAFFVSDKQHLAAHEGRSKYTPFRPTPSQYEELEMEVNFGHPLYTSISDIFVLKSNGTEPVVFPVIPDGCISLVSFGIKEFSDTKLCGPIDEMKKIVMNPGEQVMMIRFFPGATSALAKIRANNLTNKAIDIKKIFSNGEQIVSALNRDISFHDKSMLVSKLIKVGMAGDDANYLIRYCTDQIFQRKGNLRVKELAQEAGFSERYLGKVFEKFIGISPKVYCEIIRMQVSLGEIFDKEKNKGLVDVALESGFFDHAHMNRFYKKFLHCSAGVLRKKGFNNLDYSEVKPYLNTETN